MEVTSRHRYATWAQPQDVMSGPRYGADGNATYEVLGRRYFLQIVLKEMAEASVDTEEALYGPSRGAGGIIDSATCIALPVTDDGSTWECPYAGCPSLSEFIFVGSKKGQSFYVEDVRYVYHRLFYEAYVSA